MNFLMPGTPVLCLDLLMIYLSLLQTCSLLPTEITNAFDDSSPYASELVSGGLLDVCGGIAKTACIRQHLQL